MREYGKLASSMWTRGSGKRLRGKRDAQALGAYLVSAGCSNMIGLYHITIGTMVSELGWDEDVVRAALSECDAAGFAMYDEDAELVWVPNVAGIEIGDGMSVGDKRRKGVEKELRSLGSHRFVDAFVDKYGAVFNLAVTAPRQHVPIRQIRKPLPDLESDAGRGFESGQEQEQEQGHYQGQDQGEGQAPSARSTGLEPRQLDTHVRTDDPFPDFGDEVAATVEVAMVRKLRDVRAEWLAFCGHYATKLWRSEVRGKWQKWLTKAAKDQAETDKRDAERSRASPPRGRPPMQRTPDHAPWLTPPKEAP